jgi:hypothetical protein
VTRRPFRIALAVPLLAVGFGTASAATRLGPAAPLCAHAALAHHAGIVVEHGDGQVVRQCVGFDTATITALAVLQTSGIENATESYGGLGQAVCQIDHEPTSYTQCLPSSGSYWVFFISRGGGAWASSSQGVSIVTLGDGDDVGFRYDPLAGADPPPVSPAGTCATSTPTPAPTPTAQPPTPTPRPTPVATAPSGGTTNPAPPPPAVTVLPAASTSSGAKAIATEDPTASAGGTGGPSPASAAVPVADASRVAAVSSPFTPGLLLASGVVVALMALVGVQGIRRRRR